MIISRKSTHFWPPTFTNSNKPRLLDLYSSYYGGFLCVCWSPDGKYVVTGGQDDLLSIWSVAESQIVARCQGHQSWVTDVCFDPWRCDDRNYRFGSVGEDCRLLLWDFSVGMLRRPKAVSTPVPVRSQKVIDHSIDFCSSTWKRLLSFHDQPSTSRNSKYLEQQITVGLQPLYRR